MSLEAQNWVITHSRQTGSPFLVLLMIAFHARPDGTNSFPSVSTLARECCLSERQVTRIIETRLRNSGELAIERSAGRRPNRYQILIDPVALDAAQNASPNPDKSVANPDTAMSPELSIELNKNLNVNTNTPRARATPESAGAGVCMEGSRFSFQVRSEHADRNNLGGGWLTNSKDGRYDDVIALELERLKPEAVAARRPAADNTPPLSLDAARAYVRSVRKVGTDTDLPAFVEQLFRDKKISDQTRHTLLLELPGLQAAAAPAG